MEEALEVGLDVAPRRSSLREAFLAVASILNRSDAPVALNLERLRSAALALEIVGLDGAAVLLPPPPIPREPPRRRVLQPGERHRSEFPNFVPQWTPAGLYRVRLTCEHQPARSEDLPAVTSSGWIELEISE